MPENRLLSISSLTLREVIFSESVFFADIYLFQIQNTSILEVKIISFFICLIANMIMH